MFKASLNAVLRSAVSFFDTTPMGTSETNPKLAEEIDMADVYIGRVMSRLSKDQDTIDTEISMIAFQVSRILIQVDDRQLTRHSSQLLSTFRSVPLHFYSNGATY